MAQHFSRKYQGFLSSRSTFLLLFFSVAKHNVFGNQPKTMFLRGMLKDDIVSIVEETILCPDEPTTKRGRGKYVAKKTFPNDVGEFVEFDQEGSLCKRSLNVVKVVFTKNKYGQFRVITAYPTKVSIKFPYEHLTLIMHLFTFSAEGCQWRGIQIKKKFLVIEMICDIQTTS